MRVRARVKTPDQMPEWAKCCEEGMRLIHEAQGREMVVETDCQVYCGCFCLKCGEGAERTRAVSIVSGAVGKGNLFMLEWLDLEEGGIVETVNVPQRTSGN